MKGASLLLAALLLAASGTHPDPLDAPPVDLSPSAAHLSGVLRSNTSATGRFDETVGTRSVEDWSFTVGGKAGTEHIERSGTDYESTIRRDPFTEEYGQLDGARWHRDQNGFTSSTTDEDTQSFLPLRVLDVLSDPKNDLSLAGETSGAAPAYVIKVMLPQEKHPEWVFVDKNTSLITRIDDVSDGHRETQIFDDYHLSAGIEEPWHIHFSDGPSDPDMDWKRLSLAHPAAIDRSHFAPPPSSPTVSFGFADTASLPVTSADGIFIVRLYVQGRGLDFIIDSGASHSVIDRGVARGLHLPTFGQVTEASDGSAYGYTTILDNADVGPMRLHNFALDVRDFNYQFMDGIKVVGVLGYDFLAGTVLHLDYDTGHAELLPPAKLAANEPFADGFTIPVTLDDGVPFVRLGIGDGVAKRVIVDTAFPFTMFFGSYVEANSAAFPDGGQQRRKTQVPFADDRTYGLDAEIWVSNVSHFAFGPISFDQYPLLASNFDLEDADGLLGANYLSNYNVYFDYARSRIIVRLSKRFQAIKKESRRVSCFRRAC